MADAYDRGYKDGVAEGSRSPDSAISQWRSLPLGTPYTRGFYAGLLAVDVHPCSRLTWLGWAD